MRRLLARLLIRFSTATLAEAEEEAAVEVAEEVEEAIKEVGIKAKNMMDTTRRKNIMAEDVVTMENRDMKRATATRSTGKRSSWMKRASSRTSRDAGEAEATPIIEE